MIQERSLLQKIREKELAVSISVDQATRESEEVVQSARRDAENILKQAGAEGAREATTIYENEMKKVQQEIERLQSLGTIEAAKVREKGEQRLTAAVDHIVKSVLLE
jgi:vacuolar-type H+-ATPase subunit H